MTMLRVLGCGLLFAAPALAPYALAQQAGERLWALPVEAIVIDGLSVMSQPRVAPDGTVYLVTNQLYAISPAGEVLWTAPASASYVDVGPDGTIYTAGVNTIYAYNPDGTEQWSFTESPQGQGIMQGPTIGPDGNLYAISDLGGLGAFSLTPQGDFRWNVPGFSNNAGTGLGQVQFGPNNLYFAEDWATGCAPLTSGLASITLDGELEWCVSISGVRRPWATLDGKALTTQGPSKMLQAYGPDGEVAWTYTFGGLGPGIGSFVVGPDNNIYAFQALSSLASLTADGDLRWEQDQPINNFPWRAAVSPDLAAVVAGSVYGFGQNGTIIAADPADGSTLWSLPVTGPSAGAGAPAAFSPDGNVVYVPVNTVSFDDPDELWAVRVHARPVAGPPSPGVAGPALALSAPAPNPSRGGGRLTLTLGAGGEVSVAVYDALGRRVAVLHEGPLAAGTHRLGLDASALPAGVYVVRAASAGSVATSRAVIAH